MIKVTRLDGSRCTPNQALIRADGWGYAYMKKGFGSTYGWFKIRAIETQLGDHWSEVEPVPVGTVAVDLRGTRRVTVPAYSVQVLKELWEKYHGQVHTGMVPCDANPGDDCSVEGFLNWLSKQD